jgi:hypothetical protein
MVRGPGMIVSYEYEGKWVPKISDSEGHYLIGLFILRGEAELADKFTHRTLEEEIRHNEPAAHDEWKSSLGVNGETIDLVEKIQRSIVNAISDRGNPHRVDERDSTFSSRIGECLLPHGFGNTASPPIHKSPSKLTRVKSQNTSVQMTRIDYKENGFLELQLEIYCAKSNEVELLLGIGTEGSYLSPTQWHSEIGTNFPFEFIATNVIQCGESNPHRKKSKSKNNELVSKSINITPYRIIFILSDTNGSFRCKTLVQTTTSDAALVLTAREIPTATNPG